MANPSPKVENLRPPWPRGTSGNPAGYSRGRRISDAIKTQIEEMGLDREFAATAIAKALGQEHVLKQKVESAGKLFQEVPAPVGSAQVALEVPLTLPRAADAVTTSAVERRLGHRGGPILHGLLELFHPARHAARLLAFLAAQLAGLFTGGIRRFLPGNIQIRPRFGHGLGRTLAEIVAVALFLLFHQAIVLDHQRAGDHVVQAAAVVADQQDGSQVVHHERLEQPQGLDAELTPPTPPSQGGEKTSRPNSPPPLAKGGLRGVAGWTFGAGNASENRSDLREVAAEQAGALPRTLLPRCALSVLSPVLAPKGDPD